MKRPKRLVDAADRERAVTDLETNLVVTAGAGTGKTSILIERVLYLVLEAGASLTELAVITFTEKAAAELRDRLEEALERILETLTTPAARLDAGREADRVAARLDLGRSEAAAVVERRAHRALAALDHATVGTIHSLAGELLRRHHRAAGVDVGFQVDADETAYDELFRELWSQFLEETLREDEVAPAWGKLLERCTIDDVTGLAQRLSRFGYPSGVLDEGAGSVQLEYAIACARALAGEVEEVRRRVAGARRVNRNFLHSVDTLERVLRSAIEQRTLPSRDEVAALSKKPTPGARSDLRDPGAVQDALSSIRERVLRLASSDVEIPAEIGRAIGAFLCRFRGEYLRRGWVSYDALIELARKLLKEDLDVRRQESARYRQLLVDEFQDTDPAQYEIVFFLAGKAPTQGALQDAYEIDLVPGKLFIVGDAKQSIYRFRGADIDAYHRAVASVRRQGGEVLTLRTNFRSTTGLVEPLNRLFESYFAAAAPGQPVETGPSFGTLDALRREGDERASIEVLSVGEESFRAAERRQAEAAVLAAWLDRELRQGRVRRKDVAILFRALTEVDVYLRFLRRCRIPYLVEGGRGFYERYEVALLVAFLRALSNPADEIALISCLRSPLGAVPDRELQLHARELQAQGRRWSLHGEPDAEEFPGLARALAAFRAFAARHRGDPIDVVARAALDELPLRLSMSASYEGAQRVANLEKAVLHIARLARDGRASTEDILAWIEREDAAEKHEADSPLADESIDAVRVLSIHKAKGLEWPVVIVPDLSRDHGVTPGAALETGVLRHEDGLPAALRLRVGTAETPALIWHRERDGERERAETKRLFYVVTTRARDRLVLLVGGCEAAMRGRCDWVEALSAWRYEPKVAFSSEDARENRLLETVLHRRVTHPGSLPRRQRASEPLDAALLEAARSFAAAQSAMRAEELRGLEAPSSLGEAMARRAPRGGASADGPTARAAGTAVHLLLELWDGRDTGWLYRSAARAVDVAVGYEPLDAARVLAAVRTILDEAAASGQLAMLAGLDVLGREVPLLYRDEDGRLWDGALDLVANTPRGPEVLDYKTDAAPSLADLEASYHSQLHLYARGLRAALGLERLPCRRLVWLRKP